MKDELQLKLVEILTSIQTTAGKAGDFAMGQLPDIAQSYIVYGRVKETLALATAFTLAILCAWIAVKYGYGNKEAVVKRPESYFDGDWLECRVAAAIFGTAGAVLFLSGGMLSVGSALLVWFAPKVWLLKELATLVK